MPAVLSRSATIPEYRNELDRVPLARNVGPGSTISPLVPSNPAAASPATSLSAPSVTPPVYAPGAPAQRAGRPHSVSPSRQ